MFFAITSRRITPARPDEVQKGTSQRFRLSEKPHLQVEERYQCGEIIVKDFRLLSGSFDLRPTS